LKKEHTGLTLFVVIGNEVAVRKVHDAGIAQDTIGKGCNCLEEAVGSYF
jgi:hypothetical protein